MISLCASQLQNKLQLFALQKQVQASVSASICLSEVLT